MQKPTPQELLIAIRAKCLDCSGGMRKEVHGCKITDCPLWPYRRSEGEKKQECIEGQISLFNLGERGA